LLDFPYYAGIGRLNIEVMTMTRKTGVVMAMANKAGEVMTMTRKTGVVMAMAKKAGEVMTMTRKTTVDMAMIRGMARQTGVNEEQHTNFSIKLTATIRLNYF
jgi:hypothetical protein